jgi:hypothetical protein
LQQDWGERGTHGSRSPVAKPCPGRLHQLSRGLACEISLVREEDDLMLYVERLLYLTAMGDALQGIETARVVLAKACQRLNGHMG